jgi:hypothetical protein
MGVMSLTKQCECMISWYCVSPLFILYGHLMMCVVKGCE